MADNKRQKTLLFHTQVCCARGHALYQTESIMWADMGMTQESNHESTQNQIDALSALICWFESGHFGEVHIKGHQNLVKTQKRSTKCSESLDKINKIDWKPQNVTKINSWFESSSHDLIWISIPDSWVMSWFELNILKGSWVIGQFESIFRNPLSNEWSWIKTFWDWVELNKNKFELYPCLHVRALVLKG